jgi:L-lactate dehydrogenase (cytochrome)
MRLQDFAQLAQRPARPAHPVDAWLNIEDAQTAARKRLPKSIYEYLEGGAENEASLRRNQAAYEEWRLVPRWGAVEGPDLSIDIFGGKSGLPLFLSPTGGSRLFHPDGEVATLTAAAQAGIPFGLAGLSNTRMEDVSAAAPHSRRWFNLELSPDKGFLQAMLDRIQNAGYEGIIINLDCRVIGHRERDYRNGFSVPPSLRMKTIVDGVAHPRWSLRFISNDAIAFPNLTPDVPEGNLASTPEMWRGLLSGTYQAKDWSNLEDLRRRWTGPIILKGVVSPADVAHAESLGFDAVQVSNHGGRQLDHMASPLDMLPEITDATQGEIALIVDGGIRRGVDVVKALALGASAVSIGRPHLYGLAAAGATGVSRVIAIFEAEIRRAMYLLGCSTIAQLRDQGPTLLRNLNQRGAHARELRPFESSLTV